MHLLQDEDLYGYQITHAFATKSNGGYTMLEGSLYPILYRMVDNGYISDYSMTVGKRRQRKYYHIEEKGIEYYKEILSEYDKITESINLIFERREDS